jgi:hypothetical protein
VTSPRPDQRHAPGRGGLGGSRSGAGDTAGALGYPGISPAVPNCNAARALRRSVSGAGVFFTFPAPGRIWTVLLSYTVVSGATFSGTAKFAATIQTVLGSLPLAVVELSLAAPNQAGAGVCPVSYAGLPLVTGDSLTLTINGGTVVPGADQEASAVVLYSIP